MPITPMTRPRQRPSDPVRRGKMPLAGLLQRALTLALAGSGLAFACFALPQSEASEDFRYIETRLLHFDTFSGPTLTGALQSDGSASLSACDTHSQRALLLMEIPLAEAALRSGATVEFDQHIRSLETRSSQVLACAPRDSFVWLLAFDLEVLHGKLDDHAFNLLAMSYETSPNEAWISVRRVVLAVPLLLVAPESLRPSILSEFQQLIRNGFAGDAARGYLHASPAIRALLRTRIEQLDPAGRKAFNDALQPMPAETSDRRNELDRRRS